MTTTTNPAPTTTAQPQLLLIIDGGSASSPWQLSDETREIGRKGLAQARAALQASRPAHLDLAA